MKNMRKESQSTEARNSAISNMFSKKSIMDLAVLAYKRMSKDVYGNTGDFSVVVGNGYRVTFYYTHMKQEECRLCLNIYLEEKCGSRYVRMRTYNSGYMDMATEYMYNGSWKSVVVYAIKDAIESMVSKVLDKYIKDGDKWSIAEWEKLSGMVYMAPVLEEAPSLDEAPVLDEVPSIEDDYTIEEVCDGFYEIVFNDEDDDDITEDGYSVAGLDYVRENLWDVEIMPMLKDSMGDLFNDPYTMENIMRGGVLDQEKFTDALWDIVWEEHLCGLTDEALEAETRYYTDFDALCLQMCGGVAAYDEVMRVVKEKSDSTCGAQGFAWDLFSEETMLTLFDNEKLVEQIRDALFESVGCSDILLYDDCLYLWYDNDSYKACIVAA